jgi:hypothetical protein
VKVPGGVSKLFLSGSTVAAKGIFSYSPGRLFTRGHGIVVGGCTDLVFNHEQIFRRKWPMLYGLLNTIDREPSEETLSAGIRFITKNTRRTEGQGKTSKFSDPLPRVFEGLNKI